MICTNTAGITSVKTDADQNNGCVVASIVIAGDAEFSYALIATALSTVMTSVNSIREKIKRSPVGEFVPLPNYH
jgi:hypothetical protein